MMSINLSDIAFLSIKGSDYRYYELKGELHSNYIFLYLSLIGLE